MSVLIYSDFTNGSGSIPGATTDTGSATWLIDNNNSTSGTATNLIESTAGATNDVNEIGAAYVQSSLLSSSAYYVEIAFRLNDSGHGTANYIAALFNIDPSLSSSANLWTDTTRFAAFTLTPFDNYPTDSFLNGNGQTNDASGGIGKATAGIENGDHTLRVECRGTQFKVFLNSTQVWDTSNTTDFPNQSYLSAFSTPGVGFAFNQSNTRAVTVLSFEAGSLSGASASISSTEVADATAITTSVTTGAAITATEAADSTFMLADALIFVTELPDSTSLSATVTTGAYILATEAADTASITGRNLGYIEITEAPDTMAANATTNWANAALALSGYELFGQGQVNFGAVVGADLTLSGYTVAGASGAVAAATLSGYTVTAAATAPSQANATLRLSGYTIQGAASTNNLADAELVLSGYAVQAYGGAAASLELSGYTVDASGFAGNSANASATLSGYTVSASAIVNNSASADLVLSGYEPISQASAFLTLSGYSVAAEATVTVTVEYEAYSATIMRDGGVAVTRFTNFPFTQFIRFLSQTYGVADDGLYLLTGSDDDGTAITGTVQFCPSDFGSHGMKRPCALYLYGKVGGDAEVSVTLDEDESYSYQYTPANSGKVAHRIVVGRGIQGQWLGFGFASGDDFQLTGIEPDVEVLKRTIWE